MGGTVSTPKRMTLEEKAAFGLNDLHFAIANGELERVKELLIDSDELCDAVTNDGYSVFHLAACSPSAYSIFLALTTNAVARSKINAPDHRGFTPLHLLVSQNQLDCLEHALYLLDLNTRTKLGMNALHLAVQHPKMLSLVISAGVENIPDGQGRWPLHVCAALGLTESGLILCRAFPDSINELSQDGATALELACKNNHADTLSMLLSLGGDVKIHGGFGATALHRAVEQGALECARLLLLHDRSVVLEADDDGMTPLHYLAGNNKLSRSVLKDLVNLLTGVEPSLIDRTDYSGATALIKASFYLKKPNGPFLVALLLEKGADPTIEYSHGWSSAHIVHSEDETSELLPIMLSRFGPDKPFDPNKPRVVNNDLFYERRQLGLEARIPQSVRDQVLEGRSGDASTLAWLLNRSSKVVVLCGAGISTSVGVPDFRSETGVYRDEETKKMFDAATFDSDPSVMYRGCKKLFGLASNASLSAAHRLFGMLEKKGKLLRIYDQNVDGITQRSMKDPDDKIRACHGTVMKSHCPNCELKTGSAFYDSISGTGAVVLCPRCRGAIRPDITLFGESLPEDVFRDSFADFRNCDLLLVMGTSLKVYPVAGLVNRVTDTTARVLINREVVGNFNSSYRDVKLIGDIDKQVSEAVKILGWQ